jgi:hypothetical protein
MEIKMITKLIRFCIPFGLFLVSCATQHELIKTVEIRPDFSIKEWQKRKICIFPSFASEKARISSPQLDELMLKYMKMVIPDPVSASHVKKMIVEKNLAGRYEKMVKHFRLFEEVDEKELCEISSKLGLGYVVSITALNDAPFSAKDEFNDPESGYEARTIMRYYRISDKTLLGKYSSIGRSSKIFREKSSNDELIEMILGISPDKSVPAVVAAYSRSIGDNFIGITSMFTGECIKGDCQNGAGTFNYYDARANLKLSLDKYEGSWRNGRADGYGILYVWDDINRVFTRKKGLWKEGVMISSETTYYLVKGNWTPVPPVKEE